MSQTWLFGIGQKLKKKRQNKQGRLHTDRDIKEHLLLSAPIELKH